MRGMGAREGRGAWAITIYNITAHEMNNRKRSTICISLMRLASRVQILFIAKLLKMRWH